MQDKGIEKKERNTSIELLRILSMIGVICLHYNCAWIGKGFSSVVKDSTNYYVLYFLESLFICAVNVFILITGYFMCTSKSRSITKPLQLIVQVVVFKICFMIKDIISHHELISKKSLIKCLLPDNYFVILYIVLYFLSVYMNLLICKLSKKQFSSMLIVLIIIFSIWNNAIDIICTLLRENITQLSTIGMEGSQAGYTIVNFILIYFIGAYIRLHVSKKYNICKLMLGLLICVLVMTLWALFNINKGYSNSVVWAYYNPFVILEAVIVFLIFINLKIKKSKVINNLAKGTFSVYLLQTELLKRFVQVERFVNGNVFIMIGHIIVVSIAIYLCGYIINVIYNFVMTRIFKLFDKHLEKFSIKMDFST